MPKVEHITVTSAEAGQKLFQFLQRRYGKIVPKGAYMRWIRTGQVRVDGKRAKPFTRLEQDQVVRIPPFQTEKTTASPEPAENKTALDIVHETNDLLVVHKPAGLATHPGTGHKDSLQTRLNHAYQSAPFAPTPAHRLDKNTSGLVLVAKSYTCLRELHEQFQSGHVHKTYLAWVSGTWPHYEPVLMEDKLEKQGAPGNERVAAGKGKISRAQATCLLRTPKKSLLSVLLFTGRTHQIRVQLSTRGFPIIGDTKYSGPPADRMYLHAYLLEIPQESFQKLPDWKKPFTLPTTI